MLNNFTKGTLNVKSHIQIFKSLLLISNIASFIIYLFMHLIFFDFPIEWANELLTLVKLFSVASAFALSLSVLILLADTVEFVFSKRKQGIFSGHFKTVGAALILLIVILSSCNGPVVTAGIKKDFNTGMSSSYSGMEPEKTFLVMNNEVLNHTDIPLGESFLVVNDNIKGLQEKNGKVTVGCLLKIADKTGKILLEEKDLFAGHDTFDAKDAKMLKCTVSTGDPMKWEEKYNVTVMFWDKNGTGKIENTVTIRSIDIP
ncbi:MAG: hypothetical protein V4685_16660 [Bacteroidota bacterium]